MTVVTLQFSTEPGADELPTLTTGHLPKAVREGDEWVVNGSVIEDDETLEIFAAIKEHLAVLVAKRDEEVRVSKVAQILADLPTRGAYSLPPTAQSLIPQAKKIIALVKEIQ